MKSIIINLKTYHQRKGVIELAKKIQKINKNIILGVQASNIYEVVKKTNLRVFSEHVDPYEPGRHTGFIIPETVKKDGAKGTFLNHSEHKISFKILKKTIERCKDIKLKTAVFAGSLKEAKKIERLKPNYLIYEPPELVAGNISVSKSKPKIIAKIAKKLDVPFLVGAGIKNKKDVETAIKFGASGIAISSAITKARNPEKKLRELVK